jgi:hypothetical protein
VATQQIAQSLAYMSWLLLGSLALGSLGLAWLLRQATDATKGFLGFTALCASLIGCLWLAVDVSLPLPADLAIRAAPELDTPRRLALGAFAVLGIMAGVRLLGGGNARLTGLAALAAGVLAMAAGSLGWAVPATSGIPLLVQSLVLATVTGGSLCAVILAHWYLVTPRISAHPLVLTTRLLVVAIGLQLLLFLAWQTVGYPQGPPFGTLTGPNALFVWLRLGVGLLFPLVLAFMAYRTALTRSMESATGLLYIELTAVLASTIVAAAMAVSVGLLL